MNRILSGRELSWRQLDRVLLVGLAIGFHSGAAIFLAIMATIIAVPIGMPGDIFGSYAGIDGEQ
jgi:hypothetical protein